MQNTEMMTRSAETSWGRMQVTTETFSELEVHAGRGSWVCALCTHFRQQVMTVITSTVNRCINSFSRKRAGRTWGGKGEKPQRINAVWCYNSAKERGCIWCQKQNKSTIVKGQALPGHLWLMAVIPATQEAKIRRITVQSQPQAYSLKDPFSKYPTQKRTGRQEALSSNPS
jgi:hypothetical protein